MTNTQLHLRALDIPGIQRFTVGFDSMIDELMRTNAEQPNTNYPPYNIVKHTDDKFTIELAVAGFDEQDIKITVDKNALLIKGEQRQTIDELDKDVEYLHRGISARNFARSFRLADYVEVVDATATNGILKIELERQVPEAAKPKTIRISSNK